MSKVIFLDAGHGGINPSNGKYTTYPSKMFQHNKGEFHDKTMFYEGVKNREYCSLLHKKLVEKGVTVVPVYHDYKDTSLHNRVFLANWYHSNIAEGIYISEHSNATSKHDARGFSAWTSPGTTKSDEFAEQFINMYEDKFVSDSHNVYTNRGLKTLTNMSDGDKDYEAKFYVLRQTNMPSVLLENLFFDNYYDACLLMWGIYKEAYTDLQAEWIQSII